ncbi:MAG: response regulator [Gammaproteobacteria bacterium]|nr:response regulator [Gammaproteobacteria bacterium]
MTSSNPSPPGGPALRETLTALSAATLRIIGSLDLDTVLREIVESARALTGARTGVIATVDEAGRHADVHFSGLTPDEERELDAWPDGGRLFEHLRHLPGPLRLADYPSYVRSLGLVPPPALSRTFQGTPIRHRGADIGSFFLGDRVDGGEFSDVDEEVLTLFAAQAGAALANARAHRAERRARADLEALIETSPVGVVVFDAGEPASLNREAKRLANRLDPAGRNIEELLKVVVCRRADGREVSLAEFPQAAPFASLECLRSEEVVLSVPDGHRVRMLVNVTPLPGGGRDVGSIVVTMQDLAPLDEIDRMRDDFVSLVSHELRQPLAAIKGSAGTLLEAETQLDPAEVREFHRIIADQADHMRGLVSDLLDAGRIDSGTLSVAPESSDVASMVERARGTFLCGGARHAVLVDLPPGLPRVMADRRRVVQVLTNLLANAARHSPESVPIRIGAVRDGTHVAVAVADGGRGIAPERLPHLFRKRVGHADKSGYGLGLAISKGLVEAHGGRIWAESAGLGQGATLTFTIPVAEETDGGGSGEPTAGPATREAERVLVVDDDPHTLRFVRDALAAAGFAPVVTGDDQDLGRMIRREKPRLVLLDLMLRRADGIELMGTVPELAEVPVIFISGYGRDETVARALEAGATDYLVKPFSPTELVARVRAALRRHEAPEAFRLGELEIDYAGRRVSVSGRAVELTATEFELLRVLSLKAGRVVASYALLELVWGRRDDADTNVVRTFVGHLRRKLGDDAANPTYIFNERSVGYRMPDPAAG